MNMNKKALVIIPGFRGSSDEIHFVDMGEKAKLLYGLETFCLDWPNWKTNLSKYTVTGILEETRLRITELLDQNYEVVLMGESLGGIVACIIASEFHLRGLVLVVTPYRFMNRDDAEAQRIRWQEIGYKDFTSKTTGETSRIPYSFVEDAVKYNALEYITKITTPTTFIVGTADVSVPKQTTKELFDAALMPKEWIEIDGMEHTYRTQPEIMIKMDNLVVEIAEKYFL